MTKPLTPFDGTDVWTLLETRAAARADHCVLRWRPVHGASAEWSYAEFVRDAERVAAGLWRSGVRRGDRVLIHMNNCPEMLLTWFACARIGAVAVSTNAKLSSDELGHIAGKVAPVLGVTQADLAQLVVAACPIHIPLFVAPADGDAAMPPIGDRIQNFAALLAPAGPLERQVDLTLAPLAIQFTSGTTSRPKGAVFTHANALWGARVGAAHMGLNEDDVSLVYLPLFHIIGLSWITLAKLWAGGTIVLQPRFSASRFWPVAVECCCTFTVMMRFCLTALDRQEIPQPPIIDFGITACSTPALGQRYRVRDNASWGMTEMVTEGTVSDPSLPCALGSIGRPAPEYPIRIVNDDCRSVPSGDIGHLQVRAQRAPVFSLNIMTIPPGPRRPLPPMVSSALATLSCKSRTVHCATSGAPRTCSRSAARTSPRQRSNE